MSVSPQDVEKVALLARLAISESDLPEVTKRFGRVLGLVDELNTIDTETVVPMSNPHDMHQRLRPDAVTRQNDRENLMASAPAQDQGYFGAQGHRLMTDSALLSGSVSSLRQQLRDRVVSSEEVTRACLCLL